MTHFKHEKKINRFVVFSFIAQPVLCILSFIIYPPDFSKEVPVYDPNSIMLMVVGTAFLIGGLTVMGVKLADEKKVLAAAGFTMLAISVGILTASIFEISSVVNMETYIKFYRIQAAGNVLYLPAMYLISEYEDFKKWIRYIGLVSAIILITASVIFLFGSRDFILLETISNTGYFVMFATTFSWAWNVNRNFKRKVG